MTGFPEPVCPATTGEAVALLRDRADLARRVSFNLSFYALPAAAQRALYGLAGQLEAVAEFVEWLDD